MIGVNERPLAIELRRNRRDIAALSGLPFVDQPPDFLFECGQLADLLVDRPVERNDLGFELSPRSLASALAPIEPPRNVGALAAEIGHTAGAQRGHLSHASSRKAP